MQWYGTRQSLSLDVACDGQLHQIRWDDGHVRLTQHPNLESEIALVALGGAEPACLTLVKLWNGAISDGGFLEEWAAENHLSASYMSWLGTALDRLRLEGFQEFLRDLPLKRAALMGQFVYSFPLPWLNRAAAEVSNVVNGQPSDGGSVVCVHAERHLGEATAYRLRRAFVSAVGVSELSLGAAALVKLKINPGGIGGPTIAGNLSSSSGISLSVGKDWLHAVWALGAHVIADRLVVNLDIDDDSKPGSTRATVQFVEWREGEPSLFSLDARIVRGHWELHN